MTDDIDAMPAGAELDWLVNERVMKRAADGSILCIGTLTLGTWSPSTNIAHAFEVVFKMPAGFSMWDQGGCWSVEYDPDGINGMRTVPRTIADTLPLAICRAALKAVGP